MQASQIPCGGHRSAPRIMADFAQIVAVLSSLESSATSSSLFQQPASPLGSRKKTSVAHFYYWSQVAPHVDDWGSLCIVTYVLCEEVLMIHCVLLHGTAGRCGKTRQQGLHSEFVTSSADITYSTRQYQRQAKPVRLSAVNRFDDFMSRMRFDTFCTFEEVVLVIT
jgi:hypothetical protein